MFAGLSSCDKNYTCTCTHNDGNSDKTTKLIYEDATQEEAEADCADAQVTLKLIDANASCSL
jgi:hypothetical protein